MDHRGRRQCHRHRQQRWEGRFGPPRRATVHELARLEPRLDVETCGAQLLGQGDPRRQDLLVADVDGEQHAVLEPGRLLVPVRPGLPRERKVHVVAHQLVGEEAEPGARAHPDGAQARHGVPDGHGFGGGHPAVERGRVPIEVLHLDPLMEQVEVVRRRVVAVDDALEVRLGGDRPHGQETHRQDDYESINRHARQTRFRGALTARLHEVGIRR